MHCEYRKCTQVNADSRRELNWSLNSGHRRGEADGVRPGTTFSRAARSRRGIAGIFVGLAGVGLAISAAFLGPPASAKGAVVHGREVPASAVPRLEAIAARAAKANGDPRPDWITVVVTTHGRALAIWGDSEPTGNGATVYLITMKGRFTAYDASPPAGAALPTGRYLSLVVSAGSFQVNDANLSPRPPPVSPGSLGPVSHLHVAA